MYQAREGNVVTSPLPAWMKGITEIMRCWYCYRWMRRDNDATCTPWRCSWRGGDPGTTTMGCGYCNAIRAAVQEERERCANIAGNIMWQRFGNELDRWSGARQAAATE